MNKLKDLAGSNFSAKKYEEAIKIYTECLETIKSLSNKERSILYSSRSAAHLMLENNSRAYYDAKLAIEYRPNWPKGYYRKGMALHAMKNYIKAMKGNFFIFFFVIT